MHLGTVIHISSLDADKRAQFVSILSKMLRDRGYFTVELLEHQVGASLACIDNDLLARAICWACELLIETRVLILVSVSLPLSGVLTKLNRYAPAIELTIDAEFMTTAPHHIGVTAEVMNLPQEITQVVLLLETITDHQQVYPVQHLADGNVYSDREEALLEEHLRALGYM